MQEKIIYLLDDDEIFQFIVTKLLQKKGWPIKLISFPNGEEALKTLQQYSAHPRMIPDLILLDINMPLMNGWDFLEAFKIIKNTLQKKVPIFMISSSINANDIERAQSYQEVVHYISKPINENKLEQLYKYITDEHPLKQHLN